MGLSPSELVYISRSNFPLSPQVSSAWEKVLRLADVDLRYGNSLSNTKYFGCFLRKLKEKVGAEVFISRENVESTHLSWFSPFCASFWEDTPTVDKLHSNDPQIYNTNGELMLKRERKKSNVNIGHSAPLSLPATDELQMLSPLFEYFTEWVGNGSKGNHWFPHQRESLLVGMGNKNKGSNPVNGYPSRELTLLLMDEWVWSTYQCKSKHPASSKCHRGTTPTAIYLVEDKIENTEISEE